jgi:hypothetical protein
LGGAGYWPYSPPSSPPSTQRCCCSAAHRPRKVNLYLPKLPDGTIIWTAPTGHTYTTNPGSTLLFPTLCLPTGLLWLPEHEPIVDIDQRAVMMPRRKHTRAQNLARRIDAERRLNDDYVAERNKPPPF